MTDGTLANTVSPSQVYQIKEKMAQLEEALLAKSPGIPSLLREIHGVLKKDNALTTILSEEECNILVRGLEKQTATEIAASALKSKGGKKAISKLTASDL